MTISLTNRDVDLLETLTLKVHLATLEQMTKGWWMGSTRGEKAARERLSKLEKEGWVLRHRVNAHPMLPLLKPELTWQPGQCLPEFAPVSYRLKKRFRHPMELTTIYMAAPKAANHFGGCGGFRHRTHMLTVQGRFLEGIAQFH